LPKEPPSPATLNQQNQVGNQASQVLEALLEEARTQAAEVAALEAAHQRELAAAAVLGGTVGAATLLALLLLVGAL
jgi:hypothetical protein